MWMYPPQQYRTHLMRPSLIDSAKIKVKPLSCEEFPHPPNQGGNPVCTIENIQYLLHKYGVRVGYDVISKKLNIEIPNYTGTLDNSDNVKMAHIMSLVTLNGMSKSSVPEYVLAIADQNTINPVTGWIDSTPWDNVNRLPDFYDTLTCIESYPKELKETLIYRWLLSAVAAAYKPRGFKSRGVLTLQGPQSIGKTAWVSSLVPDSVLCEQVVRLDHHLDANNKDSIMTAVSHWLVEIGELDSSFKKDIARLKGFLTCDSDKLRRPYGRTDSKYQRKTVFCATVNEANFLVDRTGNTRFWTIPVTKINFKHDVNMQQLFAQILISYNAEEQWWLTTDEEALLEEYNKSHRVVSLVEEKIMLIIATKESSNSEVKTLTATEVLKRAGFDYPTNSQCKEAALVLRSSFGQSKRIRGNNKWSVPLITLNVSSLECDDDKY